MNRTLLFLTILSCFLPGRCHAQDQQGHVLVKLWAGYDKALREDKPADQADVLTQIKREARARKLAWDYYDACEKYIYARVQTNWKLRDSLERQRNREIEESGMPIAVFYKRRFDPPKEVLHYIHEHEKALLAGRTPAFYRNDHLLNRCDKFRTLLEDLIANDYEYTLWSLFAEEELTQEYGGRYPFDAFVDYGGKISEQFNRDLKKQALEQFCTRFEGQAAALLGREDLLELRFEDLTRSRSARSEDYLALLEDCRRFEREKATFKGSEKQLADCCVKPTQIMEQLNGKRLSFSAEDGAVTLILQNIDKVSLRVLQEKRSIYETLLENPVKSFYKADTLRLSLPTLNDGDYTLACSSGKIEESLPYKKYTLSLAWRENSGGAAIYVADFQTGEPLSEAEAELLKDGKVLRSSGILHLNAFTSLPEDFSAAARERGVSLRVRQGKRLSRPLSVPGYSTPDLSENPLIRSGLILTDRSAFTPDETVHFKAVVWNGIRTLRAASAGLPVQLVLTNAKGEEIARQHLTTGEFGSVNGSFILKRGERNGYYSLALLADGKTLARKQLRVDDFVLPTYDLVFEPDAPHYFPLEELRIGGTVQSYAGRPLSSASISYSVHHDGRQHAEGMLHPAADGRFEFVFPVVDTEMNWDWYTLEVKVTDPTGEVQTFNKGISIRKRPEPDIRKEYSFRDLEGDDPAVDVMAGQKPAWVVAELHGAGNVLLARRLVRISPKNDAPAQEIIRFPYASSYPDAVSLNILYFQNKRVYSHGVTRRRPITAYDLPLRFSRFLDTTKPGAEYEFTIETARNVECAAAIFDTATERLMPNGWGHIRPAGIPAPGVTPRSCAGMEGCEGWGIPVFTRGLGAVKMARTDMKASANVVMEAAALDAAPQAAEEALDGSVAADVPLRENFANTLAWEPSLRSDAGGTIRLRFRTADKLSTYCVQLFAHDRWMRNETLRACTMVTLPVQISLLEPQFLYEGDQYLCRIVLSNRLGKDVPGSFSCAFSGSGRSAENRSLIVPACGSVKLDVPVGATLCGELDLTARFIPADPDLAADGIRIRIPVLKAAQTLTEAHSALLTDASSRTALETELRSLFTLTDGSDARLKEISIIDMIREVLPEWIEPSSDNAIELSKALCAQAICRRIGHEARLDSDAVLQKLLACRCADGGFAWFAGMKSSPVVTALVLERTRGLGLFDPEASLHYLDKYIAEGQKRPFWFGGLNLEQYLFVRARYASIPFEEKTDTKFKKQVRSALVPVKARGLNGMPLKKARRIATLDALLSEAGGPALARRLGIRLGASSKMRKSLQKDLASLLQYAQPHRSGGVYYPNAVMPWRGLLESELYAHGLICSLLSRYGYGEQADGIRLWMMVQKETQEWKADPACLEAVAAVLDGSEKVLSARVLALEKEITLPFADIKASGNGFSLSLSSAERLEGGGYRPIEGPLRVGERIRLRWRIRSDENRSFVRLTLPFDAGLRPEEQLSAYRNGNYRSVLRERIERWYEVCPEEETTVEEQFYVVRAGRFQCPVPVVESLYASHYRANSGAVPGREVLPDSQE